MLHYQYHCACCEKVVESTEKSCPDCGSHHIRSPFGFWVLCLAACLVAAIVFKVVHVYVQSQQEVPVQQHSLLDVLKEKDKGLL
jgi:primosomal protein N'